MMNKKMIRVICIIMAALMILSVGAVVLEVFAADEMLIAANVPATGDNDSDYIIPAVIVVAAVLAVGVCLVLPKLKKKNAADETESEPNDMGETEE